MALSTGTVLESGMTAPDFELVGQFGDKIRLSVRAAQRPVALVFFPLAFSGTCTGELCALRDNLAVFEKAGVDLIGISVDNKASLRAFADSEGYNFTLLSDFWPHGAVAREYGVFLEDKGFANRATFVIDRDRIIRASFITSPGEARSVDAYRAALQSVLPSTN
jgi:peroxiredoxin